MRGSSAATAPASGRPSVERAVVHHARIPSPPASAAAGSASAAGRVARGVACREEDRDPWRGHAGDIARDRPVTRPRRAAAAPGYSARPDGARRGLARPASRRGRRRDTARRRRSWVSSRSACASRARSRACCRRAIRRSRSTTRSAAVRQRRRRRRRRSSADDVFAIAHAWRRSRASPPRSASSPACRACSASPTRRTSRADVFNPPPLLPRIPPSPEEVAALRAKLAAVPLYRENLISANGQGAAINVFFKPMSDAQYADLDLDRRIARGSRRRSRDPSASTTRARRT